jgi:hypothetical protein
MHPATLRAGLSPRFGATFQIRDQTSVETLPSGIPGVDLPRGALTEICGAASSGRTSLLLSLLAQATHKLEVCALVDATDAFDPASAAAAGVALDRLLWVRCGGRLPQALTAADWLVTGGGFGVVALDLGDVPSDQMRRIPLSSWYRLRRAVENTPTVLAAIEPEPWAKSCSSLILQLHRERVAWRGPLLGGALVRVERRKPVRASSVWFEARAVA